MVSEPWLLSWDECLDVSGLELCLYPQLGFRVVSASATLDMRHSWNVKRLTREGEFGQCEETHK
jgi:hypothetical protein